MLSLCRHSFGSVSLLGHSTRVVAGKGILYSAIATGVLGFITAILFLFCTPDLTVLFALDAPQPFVQLYALALGKKGSVFMTIIAVLGLIFVCFNTLDLYFYGAEPYDS